MQAASRKPAKPNRDRQADNRFPSLLKHPPPPPLSNSSEFTQLNYLQKLILFRAGQRRCPAVAVARLAMAFCQLGERKRILRGIPLPGQLRPDMDPVQVARAIHRQRTRQIVDVQAARAEFTDTPEGKEPEKPKESLQNTGGDHGTEGGEGMGKAGA